MSFGDWGENDPYGDRIEAPWSLVSGPQISIPFLTISCILSSNLTISCILSSNCLHLCRRNCRTLLPGWCPSLSSSWICEHTTGVCVPDLRRNKGGYIIKYSSGLLGTGEKKILTGTGSGLPGPWSLVSCPKVLNRCSVGVSTLCM